MFHVKYQMGGGEGRKYKVTTVVQFKNQQIAFLSVD